MSALLPVAWTPSRGREIDNLFSMAAAQSQPSGAALPSLIIGSHFSEEDHFAAASAVRPFCFYSTGPSRLL